MGTLYGGIAHVPLSAMVLVCELAGSYDLLVPLMLAEGIAFVALRKRSLYAAQLPSQRDSPAHKEADLLRSIAVERVMTQGRGGPERFESTVTETTLILADGTELEADLILHVADASVAEEELVEMLSAVDDVLAEIGAAELPRVLALNKVDLLDAERRRELSFRHPQAVQVSAATGEGLDDLREAVEVRFLGTLQRMELLVPYGEGGSLSELHEVAGEMERHETAEGVRVLARVPAGLAPRFERFAVDGTGSNGADPSE